VATSCTTAIVARNGFSIGGVQAASAVVEEGEPTMQDEAQLDVQERWRKVVARQAAERAWRSELHHFLPLN